DLIGHAFLIGPVPAAEANKYVVTRVAGGGEVEDAVAVEIMSRQAGGVGFLRTGIGQVGLKSSVSQAKQYGCVMRQGVDRDQIQAPVLIYIGRDNGKRLNSGPITPLVFEAAIAVAEQDGDVVGNAIGDGQIQAAVVIEIARGKGVRSRPRGY